MCPKEESCTLCTRWRAAYAVRYSVSGETTWASLSMKRRLQGRMTLLQGQSGARRHPLIFQMPARGCRCLRAPSRILDAQGTPALLWRPSRALMSTPSELSSLSNCAVTVLSSSLQARVGPYIRSCYACVYLITTTNVSLQASPVPLKRLYPLPIWTQASCHPIWICSV